MVLVLCVAWICSAGAAEQKIATIDYLKVFHGYWRTRQGDANLKEQIADLEKERKFMSDQFQKAEDNYKKLIAAANDLALAILEREKRKKDAEAQVLELRELDTRIKQFDAASRTTLRREAAAPARQYPPGDSRHSEGHG
jgi:Skp family chaperone for outer membrane proteins